jgi:hypothetical protein
MELEPLEPSVSELTRTAKGNAAASGITPSSACGG